MPPRGTTTVVAPALLVVLLLLSAAQAGLSDVTATQQQQGHRQRTQHLHQHGRTAAVAASASGLQGRQLKQQQKVARGPSLHKRLLVDSAPAPAATPAGLPAPFVIPIPPPGSNIPAEPLVPLYSPDQLRLRGPVIDDVPLDGQIISLMEQMQQAAHLNRTLSKEQLENANPLLGRHGVLKPPERTEPSQYPEGYVAICAIVKNQHKDIMEWLDYHKWIGVSKVYVYDNNSTEPLSTAITEHLHSGFVEYAFFTGMQRYRDLFRTSSQWWAYNDCITRYRHRHRWLAFIDADEFIVFHDGANTSNINTFMRGYNKYGGLALNWVVFGSSGHKQRPHGGVLVNYQQCLPLEQEQNQHVKVIANTAHLMTVGDDPHRVYYSDKNYFTVNELGNKVEGPKSPPSHTSVALYHYLTKSEGEYMMKMKRGSAAGNYKSPEFFTTINNYATASCTRAIPLGLKCCPSVLQELGPAGIERVKASLAAQAQAEPVKPQEQAQPGAGAATGVAGGGEGGKPAPLADGAAGR